MWEVFLPLFLFMFISHIQFDFLKTSEQQGQAKGMVRVFVIGILLVYHTAIFGVLLLT